MRLLLVFVLGAAFSAAQVPRIDVIDFYGLRKVSQSQVRKALGVREGDPLPSSKAGVEERIDRIPGVVDSNLEAVCCEAGNAILYVGIEERGVVHFDLHDEPDGDFTLPTEVVDAYREFEEALENAARIGDTADDLTQGHSLLANPAARAIQEKFLGYAAKYLAGIQQVLQDSSDDEQRAIAAYVIAYAPKRQAIVNDLQYALRDPSPGVRNNAARSLVGLSVLARRQPDLRLKVSPTWFVEMLNSLAWTDRNKASMALLTLTEHRDLGVMDELRDRALEPLVDMARWKVPGHAFPAVMLLGRIAGMPEKDIQDAWTSDNREKVIAAALARAKKKK